MASPVIIWQRSNTVATPIRIIDDYISYQYQKGFNVAGDFTLILPPKVQYLRDLQRADNRDKVVQFDNQYFGIVYSVEISQQSGSKKLVAKGKHLTALLGHYMRGIPGTPGSKLNVHSTDVATDIEYFWNGAKPNEGEGVNEFIARHYTDPDFWYPVTREIRFSKIGYVGLWTSTGYFDSTWVNWLDYMTSMAQRKDFGFDITIDVDGYMDLSLLSPTEKDPDTMIIASEFGDIVSSTYSENSQQFYTHCTTSGYKSNEGFLKAYGSQSGLNAIDASQAKIYAINVDCGGLSTAPGEAVLLKFLIFQRDGFLSNHRMVTTYDAKINLQNLKYKLGKDYNLGDYIWLWDAELNVDVKAQFTAYTKTVTSSKEEINPVFGFDQVGISTILRRNGVI